MRRKLSLAGEVSTKLAGHAFNGGHIYYIGGVVTCSNIATPALTPGMSFHASESKASCSHFLTATISDGVPA